MRSTADRQPAPAVYTILVVDDTPVIRAFVRAALEEEGYSVLTAVGGDAPAVARAQQPDLILLDQIMPGMDGLEVSRHLKGDPTTADIPLIVMSSEEHLPAIQQAMHAVDRLAKPFALADLYVTVARWCRRR